MSASDSIRFTVDGRPAEAPAGGFLLPAMRAAGVDVPSLCDHPSVAPSGACRLCTVEITHPDWGGWSGLVTSCLYPAAQGLQVSTRSERVLGTRRTLLELYLARCPDVPELAALARAEGVDTSAFAPRADADRCIQCGLCVRVCQDLSTAAIAPLGRGVDKTVGPRPDGIAEDCVGCLACERVCPTGEIVSDQADGVLRIWGREFALPVCQVEAELCRACGRCEEVCPTDIPRVAARRGGGLAAMISATACEGCGICAGACPTGAIAQPGCDDDLVAARTRDLGGKALVYACARSDFAGELPRDTELIPVPCVGRVGAEHLIEVAARGAEGALLMCRDRGSCPHGEGGRLGEERAVLVDALLAEAGLGPGRAGYLRPEPGVGGPARSAAAWRAALRPNSADAEIAVGGGLDRALAQLALLSGDEAPRIGTAARLAGPLLPTAARDDLLVRSDETAAGFRFRLTAAERRAARADLAAAPAGVTCADPRDFLQLSLLAREGAWQEGPASPPRLSPEEMEA